MSDFDLSSVDFSLSDMNVGFDTDNMLEVAAGVAVASVGVGILSWGITKISNWTSKSSSD